MCDNQFDVLRLNLLRKMWLNCNVFKNAVIKIKIKLPRRHGQIIDSSFKVFNLSNYLPNTIYQIMLRIDGVDGLDIESILYFNKITEIEIKTKDELNLYKQNQIVKSCEDFRSSSSKAFIFQNIDSIIDKPFNTSLKLITPKSRYPICSLFFKHANIFHFSIFYQAKSLLKRF